MRADRSLSRGTMEDNASPKFTVNQIMLLQKLKQTGLTKLQILKGLEEMEKLEDIGLGSPGLRYFLNLKKSFLYIIYLIVEVNFQKYADSTSKRAAITGYFHPPNQIFELSYCKNTLKVLTFFRNSPLKVNK